MIELQDVTKTFYHRSWKSLVLLGPRQPIDALNGVSLKTYRGEIFGLLGPNGAGKTTLIKILATLILPDSGSGSIGGYDLFRQSHKVRSLIGLVNTSERSFYWRLTGQQNLSFFASLYNLKGLEKRNRIEELMNLVGLRDTTDMPFMKYSSGQKQRLAIARALLANPEVLLMDEPTNSLDPLAASDLRSFVKEELVARYGKTILWCTHNLKEAEEMCSRFSIIHKGRVIASGSLEDIRALIATESSYQIRVSALSPDLLREMTVTPVCITHRNGFTEFEIREKEENITSLLHSLIKNNVKVYSCSQKETDLEEIFERLIQNDH